MDCANWEGDSPVSFLKVVLKVDLDWNPDSYAMPRIFRCLCWSAPFPSSSPLVLLSSSANIYGCSTDCDAWKHGRLARKKSNF